MPAPSGFVCRCFQSRDGHSAAFTHAQRRVSATPGTRPLRAVARYLTNGFAGNVRQICGSQRPGQHACPLRARGDRFATPTSCHRERCQTVSLKALDPLTHPFPLFHSAPRGLRQGLPCCDRQKRFGSSTHIQSLHFTLFLLTQGSLRIFFGAVPWTVSFFLSPYCPTLCSSGYSLAR